MQKVPVEELVENKVLPYNLYNASNEKVFDAGDVLTPGKLLQVQQLGDVFRDENEQEVTTAPNEAAPENKEEPVDDSDNAIEYDYAQGLGAQSDDFDFTDLDANTVYTPDELDISSFKGPLNKKSRIDPELQMKLKAYHIYILKSLATRPSSDIIQMYSFLKDKIISDIIMQSEKIHFYSEIKLMGEYSICHSLNVSMLSGILAYKMGLKESHLADVVLAGLLHDIGKTKIPSSILDLSTLTEKEQKIIQTHTKIGYKMLKEEIIFTESIARAALEHHEHNNGSGYPYGKSGDFIGRESRLVSVCNYFDTLTSNRTNIKIHNCHEALKLMLEQGSKRFSADALYTFVHMFSYNDIETLEDMAV